MKGINGHRIDNKAGTSSIKYDPPNHISIQLAWHAEGCFCACFEHLFSVQYPPPTFGLNEGMCICLFLI